MAFIALVLYAALFLLVFVGRILIQKARTGDTGLRTGGLRAPIGSWDWWAAWLLVLALLAGPMAPAAELLGLEPLAAADWLRTAGVVVASLGILLTLLAQLEMGAEWRIGVDAEERTGLVTDGAFGIVRNPIFSALILVAIGLALVVPNPISISGAVALIVAIEIQVRCVEEPHLRRLHHSDYASYAGRVGRFLPLVGRS